MKVVLLLLIIATASARAQQDRQQATNEDESPSADSTAYCPLTSTFGCSCEAHDGGHDLWCPSVIDQRYRLHYKAGDMWIICKPQTPGFGDTHEMTEADFMFQMRNISVGDNRVRSMQIQNCPLLTTPYADLMSHLGIPNLHELILKDGTSSSDEIEDLHPNIFKGLDSLMALKITRGSYSGFHEDTFAGLESVTSLFISGGRVSTLPETLFTSMTSLRALDLLHSDVEELPAGLFDSQTNLQSLSIDARSLNSFPQGLFGQLNSLGSLFVSNANFDGEDAIPTDLFANMTNLKNLTLQNAKGFESVHENFYAGLDKLENFVWSIYSCRDACSVALDGRMVKGMKSLQSFTFTQAFRTNVTLSDDFFEGCVGLKKISFARAGLSSLPERIFYPAAYLRSLDLSGNKITALSPLLFKGLHRLSELNLRKNLVSSISDGVFRDLAALVKLNMEQNRIKTVERSAFLALGKLEELNLEKNSLNFDDENQPNWINLKSLKLLLMSYNNISFSRIPNDWGLISLRLEKINLNNNKIGPRLDAADMVFSQSKEVYVDLSYNLVEGVDFETLFKLYPPPSEDSEDPHYGKKHPPPMAKIMLKGNPIDCDCRNVDFAKFLNRMLNNKVNFWIFSKEVVCAEPSRWKGAELKTVPLEELLCEFPSDHINMTCPNNCDCLYSTYDSTTRIECKNRSLVTFPDFVPVVNDSQRVVLDLSDNNIGRLQDLKGRLNVGTNVSLDLVLSDNEIGEVDSLRNIHPSLKSVELDGNNIVEISDDILDYMSNLESVKLASNLYGCGCDSAGLYDFVRTHSDLVSDVDEVTVSGCDTGTDNTTLVLAKMQKADLCPGVDVVVVVIVACLVIAILVLALLVLFFKETILMWVYSHKSLRYLFPGDPLEHDKIFDAFISYSNEDADFVEGQLVPELEGSKDNLRYKCLVHKRDFKAGENIAKQIVEAVSNSRRTVVILSRQFVRSEWYEEEFRAANANNKRGIVVVVYGEVPTKEEMGPLMWQYIKSNTYLKHDDQWFWDKLRYALPHKGREAFKSKAGFPRWKANKNDQLQLLENGITRASPSPNGVIVQTPNGASTTAATTNGHMTTNGVRYMNGGASNPSFVGSTYFVDNTPPGTAPGSGIATEVGS